MTLTADPPALGSQVPRLGPDTSGDNELPAIRKVAKALGLELMPWQEYALGVMTQRNGDGWAYRETAAVVARQNGKSSIIAPLVRLDLEAGRRVLHSAQNRIIPRRTLMELGSSFSKGDARIRYANGQEEIRHRNGGSYTIVAPQRGIRGHSADRVIVDELREFEDFDFVTAAEPTLTASSCPQINYFSNAGHELSIVLNDLKARAGKDPGLAYMEWSADPELHHGDPDGWAQANPGLGYLFDVARLQGIYRSKLEGGNLAAWETEHLCRWVVTMAPRLVQDNQWRACMRATESPLRPALGIGVSPDGKRASAALSWAQGDGSIGLQVLADVTGEPIDLDRFAEDLVPLANQSGVQTVGYDPWTDQQLARYFPDAQAIQGPAFANATERFVRVVETSQLRWLHADAVTMDLPYTSRKQTSGTAFVAERADPRRPITASLAAIRAVWLAAIPNQEAPSVY